VACLLLKGYVDGSRTHEIGFWIHHFSNFNIIHVQPCSMPSQNDTVNPS
jgi:hypothetical protein